MRHQAIEFVWRSVEYADENGEVHRDRAMVPTLPYRPVAARKFGKEEGSLHVLAPFEERNMAMHRACFAELNDLYNNLPETIWYRCDADGKFEADEFGERVVRFSGVEHFRHWLLIKEGWCETVECDTLQQAQRFARFTRDPFAMIERDRGTRKYLVKRAVSQSLAEMPSQTFKESMDAILARARSFVGVTAGVSRKNARRVA